MSNDTPVASTPHPQRDEGAALILVVGVGLILAMLMSVLVVFSINGTKQSHQDADWNASLAAAYAGIDEYQSRLSDDTSYYRFGNPASSFSPVGTVTLPPETNPAFGVGTAGSWAKVNGNTRAYYRYEVDNSQYPKTGRIRVRATGKVGSAVRTVTADLKQQGFIDFLYFTDYEVQDPAIVGAPGVGCYTDSTRTTLKYAWQTRSGSCNEIQFGTKDVISGPVHSNDTIRSCSAQFTNTVTTAKSNTPYINDLCTPKTTFIPGYPKYSGGIIGMPATNAQLKKETRTDLVATDVPRPGCLYTGPTQFTFTSDGKVNIKSPFTKKTRIGDADSTSGSEPAECGSISALQSAAGATITVPENNVLYVQNVPSIKTDVNSWVDPTNPTKQTWPDNLTCTTTTNANNRTYPGWTVGTTGYPLKGNTDASAEVPPSTSPYGCRAGDIFVSGQFKGAATLAAENFVFIVNDITYVDKQQDILGLVGNNAIWVYNPVNKSKGTILTSKDRKIEAALLSVAHTFQVQNYDSGSGRGVLRVFGAIAQKFRGTVGVSAGATGYTKDYTYDDRFKFRAPPKFLNPVTTTYGVTTWVESAAAFRADGTAS